MTGTGLILKRQSFIFRGRDLNKTLTNFAYGTIDMYTQRSVNVINQTTLMLKEAAKTQIKKGELPRLKCFHNGIILIVICFRVQK